MIFKRVGEGRPYPDHGLTPRQWAEVPPRQVRLDIWSPRRTPSSWPRCWTRTPRSSGTCSHTSWSGAATSTSRTGCTGRCAPRSSSGRCCTPACTWWRLTHARPPPHHRDHARRAVRMLVAGGVDRRRVAVRQGAAAARRRLRHRRRGAPPGRSTAARVRPPRSRSASSTPAPESGLADQTMAALADRGFQSGRRRQRARRRASAPGQVWTDDGDDPAARLVARQFGSHTRSGSPSKTSGAGVTVVVGDRFHGLVQAPRSAKVRHTVPGLRAPPAAPARPASRAQPPCQWASRPRREPPAAAPRSPRAARRGGHHQQVVAAPQHGALLGHQRLPVADDQGHRRTRRAAAARRPRRRAAGTGR